MPTIYVKIWDQNDQEVIAPFVYGKNGKKKRKPEDLKPKWWRRVMNGYVDLLGLIRQK